MIAYVRGRLDEVVGSDRVLIKTSGGGDVEAQVFAGAARLSPGDHVVAAMGTVTIGVVDHERTAFLGPWPPDGPDPGNALGLASTPVVLVPDAQNAPIARAGIDRAGRAPSVTSFAAPTETLGLELLSTTASGADVVVVEQAEARQLDLVRVLGGRPILALPGPGAAEARAWLATAELDAEIPIPSADDRWATIAALGLEVVHHLVQVDPTPVLEQAEKRVANVPPGVLTAAAAGVLAGRIAAGNRRWRAALEP